MPILRRLSYSSRGWETFIIYSLVSDNHCSELSKGQVEFDGIVIEGNCLRLLGVDDIDPRDDASKYGGLRIDLTSIAGACAKVIYRILQTARPSTRQSDEEEVDIVFKVPVPNSESVIELRLFDLSYARGPAVLHMEATFETQSGEKLTAMNKLDFDEALGLAQALDVVSEVQKAGCDWGDFFKPKKNL